MGTDNAPTIFRNVRNGNRLVHDVRIRVFSPQLIEIGRNELKIGVPINFVPKFAEPAKSGPSLDVEGEGRIRALRQRPEKGLQVSKPVFVRLTDFRE